MWPMLRGLRSCGGCTVLVAALSVACGGDDNPGSSGGAAGMSAGGGDVGGAGSGGGGESAGGSGGSGGRAGGSGPGMSVRFFGNGGIDDDRVKIRIDDPTTNEPGPPIDVGAGAFTVEFWMRAAAADNPRPALSCGADNSWTQSNIIIDRDRHTLAPAYGIGVAGGVVAFAIDGEFAIRTLCGQTTVLDEAWHHIAAVRASDATMSIFVDGQLDARDQGPTGDVSYPDDAVPTMDCPAGLCDYSDPFLVFGAEKHGYPNGSYNGLLDEVRVSSTARYMSSFTRPSAPFVSDGDTVGLFHFDEGSGVIAGDASGAPGGPSDGMLNVGGSPTGPLWDAEHPF